MHSTPALEAVMDLGGDDIDDEDEEEENAQGKKPEEEKEPEPVATPEAVEPETKRRKDRIVKVEEKKTVKLQRKPVAIEKGHEPVEMEVKEGTAICMTPNFAFFLCTLNDFIDLNYCIVMVIIRSSCFFNSKKLILFFVNLLVFLQLSNDLQNIVRMHGIMNLVGNNPQSLAVLKN